jgi:hypothetical protein
MSKRATAYIPELGRQGVMRACTDLLDAERIRYYRMNSGKTFVTNPKTGKGRMIKGQEEGTADILMHVKVMVPLPDPLRVPSSSWFGGPSHMQWMEHGQKMPVTCPVWIECKSSVGKLSDEQIEFRLEAEKAGELFLLVKDAAELQQWIKQNRVK